MKKSLTKVLMLALAVVSVGVLGSCKDYEEDKYNDLQHQIADQNKTLTDALADQKAYLEGLIAQIKQCDCDKSKVEKALQEIEALKARLAAAETDLAGVITSINDINETLVLVNAQLNGRIDGILDQINGWSDRLTTVETEAANALAEAQSNAEAIAQLEIDAATHEEVAAVLAEAEALYAEAIAYADELAEGLAEDIANNRSAIADLQGQVAENTADIATLYDMTNFCVEWLVNHEGRIEWIEESLEDIEYRLNTLKNDVFTKMITGVVLQGTKNPVFGSLNLPVGVTSNVLVAYYGTAAQSGQFPYAGTPGDGRFVKRSAALTAEDLAVMNVAPEMIAGTIISSDVNNAGKLYVTVNPNTVDFAGQSIQLVNSKDEASPIILSPLAANTDELTIGYSRAANGLYMADAQVTEDMIESIKFSTEGWEKDIKDAYEKAEKGKYSAAISELVMSLYKQMDGCLPALAAKATWTDAEGVDHSVYSNYNVAATAIKPLSFNFMENKHIDKFFGMDRLYKFIDDLVATLTKDLKNEIYALPIPEVLHIINITRPELENIAIKVTLKLGEGFTGQIDDHGFLAIYNEDGVCLGFIDFGAVEEDEDGNFVITLVDKEINIGDNMNDVFDAIEGGIDFSEIQNLLDYLRNFDQRIDPLAEKWNNKLIDFIDRANNKLCSIVNNANEALQPAMVVTDKSMSAFSSQAKNYPTVVKAGEISLTPTSRTAELIAPAYKKVIACTKAWKNGVEDTAARDAFNAQDDINTIINGGNALKIKANAESGVKYELTYVAVDYAGMISVNKTYIQGK